MWTNPPIVATGDFISATLWNTYIRANGLHLRGLLPDAGSAGQILAATSTTAAAFRALVSGDIPNGAITDAQMANQKVSRSGDTMTNSLSINESSISSPNTGYVRFGNGTHRLGYNGSSLDADGFALWHQGNDGSGSGLDADLLDGHDSSFFATASSVSGLAGVPSNLIAAVELASQIPSGWTRYTSMDGRMAVGAGTTFSVTWNEGTDYGGSWSHSHATSWSSHSHGASALGVSGTTSTESNSATVQSGTGASAAASSHTHTQGSLDVTGSTDNAGGGGTSSDQWTIPSRALVYVRKS